MIWAWMAKDTSTLLPDSISNKRIILPFRMCSRGVREPNVAVNRRYALTGVPGGIDCWFKRSGWGDVPAGNNRLLWINLGISASFFHIEQPRVRCLLQHRSRRWKLWLSWGSWQAPWRRNHPTRSFKKNRPPVVTVFKVHKGGIPKIRSKACCKSCYIYSVINTF